MKEHYEASMEPELRKATQRSYTALAKSASIEVKQIQELMKGTWDVHAHTGPDIEIGRFVDDIDNALEACRWGMAGFAIKCHGFPSVRSAILTQKVVDEWADQHGKKRIKVLGGVVLGKPVGGINPDAVLACARFGGKMVWTPTMDASHHHLLMTGEKGGVEVLDGNGKLLPQMRDIFQIMIERDMVLSISHQSTKERFILIEEARKAGLKRVMIDHPQQNNTRTTIDQMVEMAKMGAFMGIYNCSAFEQGHDPKEVLEILEKVGPERIVGGSDNGAIIGTDPVAGIRLFVIRLLNLGVAEATIRTILADNPDKLLFGKMG